MNPNLSLKPEEAVPLRRLVPRTEGGRWGGGRRDRVIEGKQEKDPISAPCKLHLIATLCIIFKQNKQRFPSQMISPGELAGLQLLNGKNANGASHPSPPALRLWTTNMISFFLGISLFPLKSFFYGDSGGCVSQVPSKGTGLREETAQVEV